MNEFDGQQGERNARLLWDICDKFGAKGLGTIHNFFTVAETWRCPCCYRDKLEMAALDKNGNLVCRIVFHHDHFVDTASNVVSISPNGPEQWNALGVIRDSFRRFPETLICEHCNNADAAAKRIVAAPDQFSFAPYEIASFIVVAKNVAHKVDLERAQAAFDAASPSMKLIADRLRAVRKVAEGLDDFEPLGHSASRVLQGLRIVRDSDGSKG